MNVGFALCGSFCTFSHVIPQIENLVSSGHQVIPIMSPAAYSTDTRFGLAVDIINRIEHICQKEIIHTTDKAEPIGPKKMLDILIVAPCTGNTIGKIASGITDTSVTMAVKSHLRNSRPVLIAISTNDALGASAQNIGKLMNLKNLFFVPMGQDDPVAKPKSLVAKMELIPSCVETVLNGFQPQPMLLASYDKSSN